MILLLLGTVAADPDLLMRNAQSLLTATCEGSHCAAQPHRFRLPTADEAAREVTSKDRAIRDDGSKCNVVGARRCPKKGRTILRTDFGR